MYGDGYVYAGNFNESLARISDVPRSGVSCSHCNISPAHSLSHMLVYHYSPFFLRFGADFECFSPNLERRSLQRYSANHGRIVANFRSAHDPQAAGLAPDFLR